MRIRIQHNQQRLLISILILLIIICGVCLWKVASATNLGKGDFIGYWSAVYLLHEGQNPYSPTNMMKVQQSIIHSNLDFVVMAWNPPTLFLFMLPLAWLPFQTARAVWFIFNVVILLAVCLILANLYLPKKGKALLVFCLFAVLFPQDLVAITMGQVTFLVLLGVVCCMFFIKQERYFLAGAFLILTTIKPHMVFLVVPYLLLYMAFRRKWQGWLGFLTVAIVCMLSLFIFRPVWIQDFLGLLTIAPVNWATPTIGGILSYLSITDNMRYIIIFLLPLAWILARRQAKIPVETAVALLTVLTVPITFYGWSYDQSILLIPLAWLFSWMLSSSHKWVQITVIITMSSILLINWVQRITSTSEVYYFWIPLIWAVIFITCFALSKSPMNHSSVSITKKYSSSESME